MLLTLIKLPVVIKTFVLSIFGWPFYTGFTLDFKQAWVKVFRINPEFRVLRLTFHLNMKLLIFGGIQQVLKFEFLKFRIWEILNFHP